MQNKILVALDGSDGGKRALAAAADHARLTKSDLVLCYVIDWSPYTFNTPEELAERHARRESEIERATEMVLKPETEAFKGSGINIETVVRHGKIAETLQDLCKEYHATQIYIGRLGESRVRSMIFGSVTAALVQASAVPVTVVP